MTKLKYRIVMKICDFGLWVLSLGPKSEYDKKYYNELMAYWRHANHKLEDHSK